jgi:hypothetical protein
MSLPLYVFAVVALVDDMLIMWSPLFMVILNVATVRPSIGPTPCNTALFITHVDTVINAGICIDTANNTPLSPLKQIALCLLVPKYFKAVKLLFNSLTKVLKRAYFYIKKGLKIMEKIKLSNEAIFEIIPLGITSLDIQKRRSFSFKSDLPYDEIEANFKNSDNIASIQYLSEADEVLMTYADCVSLKIISKNIETGVYTAECSTDAVELQIKQMQAQIAALTAAQQL